MIQRSWFAEENRLERLSKMGDPLEKVSAVIDWEMFRPLLDAQMSRVPKGPGGRPAYDRVMMFKIVMLQQWYHIADDKTEYMINDRLSFQRFLGLGLEDKVPDAKTIWAFKEEMGKHGLDARLFNMFTQAMEESGVITHKGSLADASFVDVPRQRNTREEKAAIKAGEIPKGWEAEEQKHKRSQKDVDGRWAKKGKEVHFGYKDHVKVDQDSKMIVDFVVTSANEHDSQSFEERLDDSDRKTYADSAYNGEKMHQRIKEDFPEMELRVCEKGSRDNPLTEEQKESNREKSRIRARVEHVFGHMTKAMGGMFIRSIGIVRAYREITLKNLAYNLQRYAYLATCGRTTAG